MERILLVDDDESVRGSLAQVLKMEGYTVLAAGNGREGLRVLEENKVDAVLLDLNMPQLNGWDAFEKMSEQWPLIPILLITARANQLFLAAQSGAAGLLEKPVDIPVMLRALRTVLDESNSTRLKRLAGKSDDFYFATGRD